MLRSDLKSIRDELKGIDELREKIIKIVRIIVRLSGSSITQIHRSEFKKANKTILEAERWIKKLNESLEDKPSIKHNGNLQVAFQEYVEAKLLYSIATNRKLISFKLLKVDPIPYILGLLDLVGELRRMVLNLLHEGKIRDAERMLN
ncbi:MAG: haloacid dehalogenase, partial [Candidatus Bathyarchaeia archaeon]